MCAFCLLQHEARGGWLFEEGKKPWLSCCYMIQVPFSIWHRRSGRRHGCKILGADKRFTWGSQRTTRNLSRQPEQDVHLFIPWELERVPDQDLDSTRRVIRCTSWRLTRGRTHGFLLPLSRGSDGPQLPMKRYLDYVNDRTNCLSEKISYTWHFLVVNQRQLRC